MALLAGLTAACSADATRFKGPIFTGSTANQRAIIGGDQPMPAPVDYSQSDTMGGYPASSSAVARSDLPATRLPGTGAPMAAPVEQPPMMASATQAPPLEPARPVKSGWSAERGTTVVLGDGETLYSVSRRYGVPVKEIARANNITDASRVGAGTRLVIPGYANGAGVATAAAEPEPRVRAPKNSGGMQLASGPAPAAARLPAAEPAAASGTHLVGPGQTLSSIARLYGVSARDLAAANDLTSNNQLRSGQRLKIPGRTPAPQAVALRTEASRREELPQGEDPNARPSAANTSALPGVKTAAVKPQPTEPVATASIAKPAATAPEQAQPVAYTPPSEPAKPVVADTNADPGSANGTSFRWPVRGRIISSFGSKPSGEKNDGINLAVPEGTSVKAAEAGTVIYAGNELEGYGNLVLVRHADGWVSAYAHNSKILVKRGDAVRRGQIISQAGASGSVNSPQVHFELRKGSKPVNPMDYLTGA